MELAKIFSNGCVLQRNKPIKIFGTGSGFVSVTLDGDTVSKTFNGEEWLLTLPAKKAGGPFNMTVIMNDETVVIDEVYIGEVWIMSGQSNMSFMFWEMYKRGVAISDFVISPYMHYFKTTVDGYLNFDKNASSWLKCTKTNIMSQYSILSYYFLLYLSKKYEGIHIAALNGSRGWTRIESWIPEKYIDGTELDLDRSIKNLAPASDIANGRLFDGYIRPFTPFVSNGVIWYQGESNIGKDETKFYSELLNCLITAWRNEFSENLPFLIVQLTAYGDSMWPNMKLEDILKLPISAKACRFARIREQQLLANKTINNTYLITTIDTGEFYQIHPTGKDIIAKRLSVAASNIIENKNDEYTGPLYKSAIIEDDKIIIDFTHNDGLYIDGVLDWIAICDKDNVYYPAEYKIIDNKLIVFNKDIKNPKCVKYAFSNWAVGGLYNSLGFPASPFIAEV